MYPKKRFPDRELGLFKSDRHEKRSLAKILRLFQVDYDLKTIVVCCIMQLNKIDRPAKNLLTVGLTHKNNAKVNNNKSFFYGMQSINFYKITSKSALISKNSKSITSQSIK